MTNNWAKWDAEHGHGGGGQTSAEKIAASIRGALGAGEVTPPHTSETRGRSGSVISRAEGSRSTANHILKKDLKRPAPVKGEKDAADSFRTRIHMAEYNRQKRAATAQDPVDKLTPKTEIGSNPHHPTGLSAKAHEASKAANFSPSADTHYAAAKAHLYAAGAALSLGNNTAATHHKHTASVHLQQAATEVKNGPTSTPAQLKKLRTAAVVATTHANTEHSEQAHRDAAEAHAQASYLAKAMNKPVIAKNHLAAAKNHSVQADAIAKNTKPGGSSAAIAAQIKGLHAEQKTANPEPVKLSTFDELAHKAEEATATAKANPSYVNHQKAFEAHKAAYYESQTYAGSQTKTGGYHNVMTEYHRFAADHPTKVIPAEVQVEHQDTKHTHKFPAAVHGLFSSFMDTVSRRRSQKMYDSVPKAADTNLSMPEKKSVSAYTGSSYSTINGHLRGKWVLTGLEKDKVEAHVANLDAAFDKQPGLPDDLITYRGVKDVEGMFGKVGEKVGSEFQDHGYGSSASHASVATGFGGGSGAIVRILHPKGSKLLKPSSIGQYDDNERELLVPRGTRFHVAADRIVVQHNGTKRRMIDLVRLPA